MSLKPGTIADFENSMAEAMETAFKTEWANAMNGVPLPLMNKQMQLMFVAIAQGVVYHLNKNPGAFLLDITAGTLDVRGSLSEINSNLEPYE